jgi:hypothetical protein
LVLEQVGLGFTDNPEVPQAFVGVLHQQNYTRIITPHYISIQMEIRTKYHPDFITTTCLEWIPILKKEQFKNIILDRLRTFIINVCRLVGEEHK